MQDDKLNWDRRMPLKDMRTYGSVRKRGSCCHCNKWGASLWRPYEGGWWHPQCYTSNTRERVRRIPNRSLALA